MELFASVLLAVQVLTSLSIIVLVLLQQGKGADMGSAFGGGSAGSLFGASGAANFLSRMTKWAAIVFFASTIGLAWVAHHPTGSMLDGGVMQDFQHSEVPGAAGAEIPGMGVPAEVPGTADVPAVSGDVPQGAAAPATGVPSVQGPDVTSGPGDQAVEPAPEAPATNN